VLLSEHFTFTLHEDAVEEKLEDRTGIGAVDAEVLRAFESKVRLRGRSDVTDTRNVYY
jgi:hypothetical protein